MLTPDPITRQLDAIHRQFVGPADGEVATYIPELGGVDPDRFGIAVASCDGGVYRTGDADHPFTIQSVSKPFVYALALMESGLDTVSRHVGAEPSGEAFNAISLEPGTGRPANSMINAGAIVTTSLVPAANPSDRFERIRNTLSAFAGHPLEMDEAVYRSEWATGDKNRALGWLMRSAGSLDADVDDTLDVYFRQCAVVVTAVDIAVMAATLANGGVNPVTGEKVVSDMAASQVLTVMATCGMYDGSGEWLLRVGLPAKSGVSGAVVAASPAQFGIGLFSPRLDRRGNSTRAVATCEELSRRFDLHLMRQPNRSAAAIFLSDTAAHLSSSTPRTERQRDMLRRRGNAIVVRAMHGDLAFADAERLLRSLAAGNSGWASDDARWLVLDLSQVRGMCAAAAALVASLASDLTDAGVTVTVAATDPEVVPGARAFSTRDEALGWCEDQLLRLN